MYRYMTLENTVFVVAFALNATWRITKKWYKGIPQKRYVWAYNQCICYNLNEEKIISHTNNFKNAVSGFLGRILKGIDDSMLGY